MSKSLPRNEGNGERQLPSDPSIVDKHGDPALLPAGGKRSAVVLEAFTLNNFFIAFLVR